MLRVACSCGKVLSVNDDLAGKKIKCPECAELLVVKRPASKAVTAKASRKVPVDDEELPRPRKRIRDEDNEDQPRAKKGGSALLLVLLLGGFAFLFFVLVAGGIGAYFLFFRDSKETAEDSPKTKGEPAAEMVNVKFFVPKKKGDYRQVIGSYENKQTFTNNGNNGGNQLFPLTNKFAFKAKIKTLQVDAGGRETEMEVTIDEYTQELNLGAKLNGGIAPDTVLLGQYVGKNLMLRGKSNTPDLFAVNNVSKVLSDRYYDDFTEEDMEKVAGGEQKRAVGSSWPIDKDLVSKALTEGKATVTGDLTGNAKVVAVSGTGNKSTVELEVNFATTVDALGMPAKINCTTTAKFPKDYSTGPVKRVLRLEAILEQNTIAPPGAQGGGLGEGPKGFGPQGPGQGGPPNAKVTVNNTTVVTNETTYLPNQGSGETKDPEPKKTTDNLKITFNGVNALRNSPGGGTVELEVRYSATGDLPAGSAGLVFFAAAIDGNGKVSPAQPIGNEVIDKKNPDRTFKSNITVSGSDVAVKVFVTGGAEDKKQLAVLDNIPIKDRKKDLPKTEPARISLANTQVDWVPGKNAVRVSVNYTVKGKPDGDSSYQVWVGFLDKDQKIKWASAQQYDGAQLLQQNSFTKEVLVQVPPAANTGMCQIAVIEVKNDKTTDHQRLNNVAVGGTPPTSAPSTPTLTAELLNPRVEQLPGNKVRITVDYRFSAKPDPNNTYQVWCNVTKTKPALLRTSEDKGNKLQQQGSLDTTIPGDLAPGAPFEIYMKEVSAANPGGLLISKTPATKGSVVGTSDSATPFQITFTDVKAVVTKVDKQGTHLQFTAHYKMQGTPKAGAQYVCKATVGFVNNTTREITVGDMVNASAMKATGTFHMKQALTIAVPAQQFVPQAVVVIYELAPGAAPMAVANTQVMFTK